MNYFQFENQTPNEKHTVVAPAKSVVSSDKINNHISDTAFFLDKEAYIPSQT